ncbi:MAG TPA: hypothetical protein VGN23_07120 [Verrucomicrobiae bacterium]
MFRCFVIAIFGICFLGFKASAFTSTNAPSTYANINIDGSFTDWSGVPLAYSMPQVTGARVQFQNLYVANDANYLYIYFTLYTAANPFTASQSIFIDTDTNFNTGNHEHGIGSDLLVQSGNGYQETSGVFNAGAVNGLNYLMASNSLGTSYELSISLDATYASGGAPVFTGNTISLYLESSEGGSVGNEWFPNASGSSEGGLIYTLGVESVPEPSVAGVSLLCAGCVAVVVIQRRKKFQRFNPKSQ